MGSQKNNVHNTNKNSVEKGPLGLSGEQYWNNPLSHIEDSDEERLFNHIEGMVIDAPNRVYIKEYNSVPLICLRTLPKYKKRKYSFETTTQLLVVHLETNCFCLIKLMRSPDIKNDIKPSSGFMSEWYVADLQGWIEPLKPPLMQIGSYPGKNLLVLLCGPERSNHRMIEIIPDKEIEKRGEYQKMIEKLRTSGSPPDISSSLLLELQHHIPPSGKEPLWEVNKTEEGTKDYRVSIRYRIRGLPFFVYPRELRPYDNEKRVVFGGLPIHIVIFDQDRSLLISRTIVIPVVNPPEGDEKEPVLTGHISFILSKITSFQDKKYLYIWFICLENIEKIEIELEKGWTDGLVPPPDPVPIIRRD